MNLSIMNGLNRFENDLQASRSLQEESLPC